MDKLDQVLRAVESLADDVASVRRDLNSLSDKLVTSGAPNQVGNIQDKLDELKRKLVGSFYGYDQVGKLIKTVDDVSRDVKSIKRN